MQAGADVIDFLDQLTSTDYRKAQRHHWERIGGSYQVRSCHSVACCRCIACELHADVASMCHNLLTDAGTESDQNALPQILDGCPWVAPKPLHVLAVPQPTAPHTAMFTLQTRVPQAHVESELSKVRAVADWRLELLRLCQEVGISVSCPRYGLM